MAVELEFSPKLLESLKHLALCSSKTFINGRLPQQWALPKEAEKHTSQGISTE